MNASMQTLIKPLGSENPITVQMLGICSALAVTTNVKTALTMSIAVTIVLVAASSIISLIRQQIPSTVRLIIQITIVATLVIVIDQVMLAFFYELSLVLSVFVGLIVTNCLVLGRTEAYAMHNSVADSAIDALGNGLGYSLIMLVVGSIRELLGFGTLFDITVFTTVVDGGWFEPLTVMQSAPSAFFIIGVLIWIIRSARKSQVEPIEGLSTKPVDATRILSP